MATPDAGAAVPPSFAGEAPWAAAAKPLVLASWTQRGLAYLLDLILLLAVTLMLESIAAAIFGGGDVVLALLFSTLGFGYFLGTTLAGGRSIGKRAFRLRIATLGGDPPRPAQAFLEALSKTLPLLLLLDLLVGLLAWRGRRQRLVQGAAAMLVLFEPPKAPKRVVFVP